MIRPMQPYGQTIRQDKIDKESVRRQRSLSKPYRIRRGRPPRDPHRHCGSGHLVVFVPERIDMAASMVSFVT